MKECSALQPEMVHISVGAGFENDRRDLGVMAAAALSEMDGPRYLIFECLAERTLALQSADPDRDALPERALSFLEPCIDAVARNGIRIVSNFGGPDPARVANRIREWLRERGLKLRVCAVTGDALPFEDPTIIAFNAYTGAAGVVEALEGGADIVVAGRVADPSLVVGPVVHELGLEWDDLDALANATMAGHLIECGTQVCGGYFADDGLDVPEIEIIGPPVVSVFRDGMDLSKPLGGGRLDRATVTQQLLYEVHDPAAYLTPDVTLDLTGVEIMQRPDEGIRLAGARGHPAPEMLKTLICRQTGWFGEAAISYTGTTAARRARIARDVLLARCSDMIGDLRLECHDGLLDGVPHSRLRVAVRNARKSSVRQVLDQLESLYTNGPAGGGGVRRALSPLVETETGGIAQGAVNHTLHWEGAADA